MPPRIRIPVPLRTSLSSPRVIRSSGVQLQLFAERHQLHSSLRHASILSALSDTPGSYQKRIRRGRGPSSGKGKTSGRGHKGQKQHGKVPKNFEGGQTPLKIVHGERGFKNIFTADLQLLPLPRLQSWIAQGRISAAHPITVRELIASRCVNRVKDGIKLLSYSLNWPVKEPLTQPLNIVVSRASAAAVAAIEKAGGTVTTRYYTRDAIKRIMRGTMDPVYSLQTQSLPATLSMPAPISAEEPSAKESSVEKKASTTDSPLVPVAPWASPALPRRRFQHRLPDPTSRKDIEYYRDPAHRGYLSHLVPEGEGPSLFFKTPGTGQSKKRAEVKVKGSKTVGDRLW